MSAGALSTSCLGLHNWRSICYYLRCLLLLLLLLFRNISAAIRYTLLLGCWRRNLLRLNIFRFLLAWLLDLLWLARCDLWYLLLSQFLCMLLLCCHVHLNNLMRLLYWNTLSILHNSSITGSKLGLLLCLDLVHLGLSFQIVLFFIYWIFKFLMLSRLLINKL
jgi:hypothetical protein